MRLADFAFAKARTWLEIQRAHRTWWVNYNIEHHSAHRERQDGRHSPAAVLRGVLGRTVPEDDEHSHHYHDYAFFKKDLVGRGFLQRDHGIFRRVVLS